MKNIIVEQDLDYIFKEFKQSDLFKNKVVLITGCAGFLGFYFIQFFCSLANRGIHLKHLILLDNFILGIPSWIETIKQSHPQVSLHTFDISKNDIATIDLAAQADYVIHMASIASPVFYRQYPLETVDANIWGLRKLLDFYCDKPIKGFLFFSSSEIYGDPAPEAIPTNEEYRGSVSCVGPRACYDEAKRFGETLCYVFSQTRQVPLRIVRPFNNFGPGMRLEDGRIPADFAKAVMNGKDLILYSDGTPTRTFCYVADAIVGYLKVLTHKNFDYFNIGMDKPEISMMDFAKIYQQQAHKILNYSGKVQCAIAKDKDFLTHNPSRRCPDISKARKLLEFAPKINPDQGVARFLEYLIQEKAK